MTLLNVKPEDVKRHTVEKIVKALLSCSDAKYIEEIYAKEGSFRDELFTNWIGLMIELSPEFIDKDLYKTIDNLEETHNAFTLVISTEPNTAERGHGIVLWKKEE